MSANLQNMIGLLRDADRCQQSVAVPVQDVKLRGETCLLSGQPLPMATGAKDWMRGKLGVPEQLEKRLDPPVIAAVYDDLLFVEAAAPRPLRRLPRKIRATIFDGAVIGFDDADLAAMSLSDLADVIEEVVGDRDCQVQKSSISPSDAEIRLTLAAHLAEPRPDDLFNGGIAISHSTAGGGATRVETYIHRLVCANGLRVPICTDKTRIRRRKNCAGSASGMAEDLKAFCRRGIESLDKQLAAIVRLDAQPVDALAMLEQIAVEQRYSQRLRNALRDALRSDELGLRRRSTQLDVINAMSRVATHADESVLGSNGRHSLSLYAGVFSQRYVHRCPSCNRLIQSTQRGQPQIECR